MICTYDVQVQKKRAAMICTYVVHDQNFMDRILCLNFELHLATFNKSKINEKILTLAFGSNGIHSGLAGGIASAR